MSRVFKSSNVNVGEPYKMSLNDDFVQFTKYKTESERSSDMSSNDPSVAASNIIADANARAQEIIANAKDEANIIVQNAIKQAELDREIEIKNGYDDGFQRGLTDGKRETEDLAEQALEIKQELEEEKKYLLTKLENHIPDIIIQGIKKIIGEELKTNRDVIKNIVSNALSKISSTNALVRLSEEDFEIVDENKNLIMSQNREISEIEIKKDGSLDKGDCIIETDCGDVDASVNTQLKNLEQAILENVGDKNVNQ